jgi:lysophospholipase L1-like esterase
MLAKIACHLWIVQLGPNDANAGVVSATYSSGLQTLITSLKATGGDVLLVVPTPASGGFNIPQGYIDAIYALSVSNGLLPPVDLNALFGSFAASSSYYFDGVHLLSSGYSRCVPPIVSKILA